MFSNAKSITCNLEMKSISAMQNPFNWKIIIQKKDIYLMIFLAIVFNRVLDQIN